MCPAEDPASAPQPAVEPTVLVVEDEIIVRLGIAAHLRDCGFKVVEAGNGGEAQTLILAGLKPDLVFSDISMPGMDGLAFVRWLAESGIDAPIVMTSGVQSALDAAKEACANVSGFVGKPYAHERLVDQFRALLAQRA
jgi:CheY-like chemotaxis protein